MRGRFIPDNVFSNKRILGFRKRNFFEGVALAFINFLLISQIPFVPKVRWIFTICVGIFCIALCGIGINGMSLTQAIMRYYKYRKVTKQYSYRRLTDADKEPKQIFLRGKDGEIHFTTKQSRIERAKSKLLGR